jgi:type VI secretion system protein ImpB
MDDFGPVEIINQIPALKKLFDGRQRLRDLLTKLDGNDNLDALLKDVISNTESQAALKKDLGEGSK